jgi:hypothetical protein
MVRNSLAIRKGMSAEYLAKAHFSKQGFSIITPDCHETNYDFIALSKEGLLNRVQVKAVNNLVKFNLARIRNKHGANNKLYKREDYDILAGVWVERNKIYLFKSEDVNETSFGETISVAKLDNTPLIKFKRPIPYFTGDI